MSPRSCTKHRSLNLTSSLATRTGLSSGRWSQRVMKMSPGIPAMCYSTSVFPRVMKLRRLGESRSEEHTSELHDALPIYRAQLGPLEPAGDEDVPGDPGDVLLHERVPPRDEVEAVGGKQIGRAHV